MLCLACEHSHAAVRFLLKAFVVRHAQGHLADLTAETAFVPILGKSRETRRLILVGLTLRRKWLPHKLRSVLTFLMKHLNLMVSFEINLSGKIPRLLSVRPQLHSVTPSGKALYKQWCCKIRWIYKPVHINFPRNLFNHHFALQEALFTKTIRNW